MKTKHTLRTVIIDDEPLALEKLRGYVEKIPFLELAGQFSGAYEAVEFMAAHDVDLIFTDINMPDLSGMDFVASLPAAPMVVFTTAYAQYAVDSYRLAAVDYLLKPYTLLDFQRAANRALEMYSARHIPAADASGSLFVKVETRYVRIDTADITHIKGYGEYLQIYLRNEPRPLLTLSSFATIMEKLPDNFLQVHRSYIVNMNAVKQVDRGRIVIGPDTEIPVSDSCKTALQLYIQNHGVIKGH